MKKLLFMCAVLLAFTLNAQQNERKIMTFDVAAGISEKGGFSFSLGSKFKNGFGWYIASRGINLEDDFFSGVDYSGISTVKTTVTNSRVQERPDFGLTAGTIYNLKNSRFSIGLGGGYGIKQSLITNTILYDFTYIKDEVAVEITAEKEGKFIAETFVDIAFKKELKNSLGIHLGYNTMLGGFVLFYYAF